MSISVLELKPGDRVVLNCPKALRDAKQEAQFQGIFASFADASVLDENCAELLVAGQSLVDLRGSAGSRTVARFLLETSDPDTILRTINVPPSSLPTKLFVFAMMEPDGRLREKDGRRIYIERRLTPRKG